MIVSLLENQTELNKDLVIKCKKNGLSDKQIANISKITETEIRRFRYQNNIVPYVKQIDTVEVNSLVILINYI